jgi:hypothetical protein
VVQEAFKTRALVRFVKCRVLQIVDNMLVLLFSQAL